MRRASASTKPSSSVSGSARFTYPYRFAVSPSKSFAPRIISSGCARKAFVPFLYQNTAFDAFDDFSDFLESISCETSKTCQVRGSNPCRGAGRSESKASAQKCQSTKVSISISLWPHRPAHPPVYPLSRNCPHGKHTHKPAAPIAGTESSGSTALSKCPDRSR